MLYLEVVKAIREVEKAEGELGEALDEG